MGRKRTRQDRNPQRSKFVSPDASERFNEAVQNRKPWVEERGFEFGEVEAPGITDVIKDLGWHQFCEVPDAAVSDVVMEFYANAPEMVENKVLVRGVQVPIDPSTINKFYGLADVSEEEDEYEAYAKEPDYDQIIKTLAHSGAVWDMGKGKPKAFESKHLTRESRMWQYFVSSRLMPITHYSTVDNNRAILLYAITRRMRFDVGRIIYSRIVHASKVTRVGYFFPCLVTALCVGAGVVYGPDEVVLQPGPRLTETFMYKLTSGDKGPISRPQKQREASTSRQSKKDKLQSIEVEVAELTEWKTWATEHLTYQSQMLQSLHEMQRLQLEKGGIDATHINIPQCPGPYDSREED